jgi:hypothetical protein
MTWTRACLVAACVTLAAVGIPVLSAAVPDAPKSEPRTVVLDTMGMWRLHHTLKPPIVQLDDGLAPILAVGQKWLHEETPGPPVGWTRAEFDDGAWLRGTVRFECDTPMVARLCLRGKFAVTDPGQVKDLRVSLGYWGGAIIYLNGTELARGHLAAGDPAKLDLAEPFPEEAYYFGEVNDWRYATVKSREMEKLRAREISDVPLPRALLKQGVNVLAIEIVRSPYNKSVMIPPEVKRPSERKTPCNLNWSTCSLRWVQLTAAAPDGLVPNATRPAGLQVWNSDLLASDFNVDFGDRTEPLWAITVVGARNGSYSGKVVAGSDRPIVGLRAAASDLRSKDATIPASVVRVRFGMPWGDDDGTRERFPVVVTPLGALADAPPAEIPVQPVAPGWACLQLPREVKPVFGAVTSVWVTIDVPSGAKPGVYEGRVTLEAMGEKPVDVPVRLEVVDWLLPDPDDYMTWVELTQSPDTLAREYGVEPWSDRHFALIARSMQFLRRIGSRVLYVPLICHANVGNEQSMVRWIRKPDGTYAYDFTIMERYLDTAEKCMGRPKVVCLWVWDKFLYPTPEDSTIREGDRPGGYAAPATDSQKRYANLGPQVTFLDPATGKTENRFLPPLSDPASMGLWKPLLGEVVRRMEKRGLGGAVMIGTASDVVPRKETIDFFKEAAPGLLWVGHAHGMLERYFASKGTSMGYYTSLIESSFPGWPEDGRSYGWKRPQLYAYLLRNWHGSFDQFPLTTWRHLGEVNITGNQRGIGHMGADMWFVVKDKGGRRVGRIYQLHPESNWRSNDICTSALAPGADGAIATTRYELMREGVQECEARIFLERALTDKELRTALGDDLAHRCQQALDERIRFMIRGMSNLRLDGYIAGNCINANTSWWNSSGVDGHIWFIASGWQERSRALYSLAGEVARKLAAPPGPPR